ncbi:MAG: putative esterase YcpF (UPF0227 family) [Sulfurimonas sp.]|jgi:predicted esterase YcpF (UPF0227 family)|uniref:YqiA/YcfP family alpha/beta fold hydrolase n=1 Tax=Sulfurimonas sp. TaxID=2022749 RepID=UPI0039E3EE26
MVIYIHGFGSSGEGAKAKLFRKYFRDNGVGFIAPSLSYIPELAIKTLEELVESYNGEVQLIGSSLGGFYSIYLSHKYDVKAVLINPSIYPYKTLPKVLGNAPSFHDESSFTWMQFHIDSLKNYEVTSPVQENFMLLTQKGDETLNFQEAIDKLPNATLVVEEGGNHGYVGIERHFKSVESFLSK